MFMYCLGIDSRIPFIFLKWLDTALAEMVYKESCKIFSQIVETTLNLGSRCRINVITLNQRCWTSDGC